MPQTSLQSPSSPPNASCSRRSWVIACGLVAVVLGLAAVPVYRSIILYRANWGVVVPGKIYRSAQMSASLLNQKLEENHINVIIFLSQDDEDDSDIQAEKKVAADDHAEFLNFPMNGDGVAAPDMYTQALTALCDRVEAGKTVLVHCHSGAQRTGGVIAVYRMLVEKMPAEQALAEMRHYGHDPRKNLTLIPFLNQNIGDWADALVKTGAIDHVPAPVPQLNPQ